MNPLFNLYGNADEGIATNTVFTDADIIAAKEADLADLKEKISTTEIISPKDLPEADLYKYCDEKINKVAQDFLSSETMEDRKVRQLMHENGQEFKCRALKYLYDNNSMELLRIIEENQLDQTQFINCLRMVHHFEMPSKELSKPNKEQKKPFDLIQTAKDHPFASVIVAYLAYKLARRVL